MQWVRRSIPSRWFLYRNVWNIDILAFYLGSSLTVLNSRMGKYKNVSSFNNATTIKTHLVYHLCDKYLILRINSYLEKPSYNCNFSFRFTTSVRITYVVQHGSSAKREKYGADGARTHPRSCEKERSAVRRSRRNGLLEKVSKVVSDRSRRTGEKGRAWVLGWLQKTRKLVRRISRRNEAARDGAKYRAIDFTARRLVR